jgi:isocitrate lyase
MVKMLSAARLAADVANVNTVLIARTDAESATLITSDIDEQDQPFIIRERTVEGFFKFKNGIEACIGRALSYAPYVDLIWFETSTPNLETAKQFAESVLPKYPHLKLAYNCSPSFNWRKYLTEKECKNFQIELGKLGYKFQFVTLAAFHSCNLASFELAKGYLENGMLSYSQLQQKEFEAQCQGFTTVKHQSEVGVQYFDAITGALGESSTTALQHSTENEQF